MYSIFSLSEAGGWNRLIVVKMKNWLKVALSYRKKNMLPSDVVEEVMLDDMSMEDATDLWMALVAVYGCRELGRCVKYYKGRYVSLDFSELFDYATNEGECDFYSLKEQFDRLITSIEFEKTLKDPMLLMS